MSWERCSVALWLIWFWLSICLLSTHGRQGSGITPLVLKDQSWWCSGITPGGTLRTIAGLEIEPRLAMAVCSQVPYPAELSLFWSVGVIV